MFDVSQIIIVAYVQAGLLLLGFFFYRRVAVLRGSLAVEEASRRAVVQRLEETVADYERRIARLERGAGQAQPSRTGTLEPPNAAKFRAAFAEASPEAELEAKVRALKARANRQ